MSVKHIKAASHKMPLAIVIVLAAGLATSNVAQAFLFDNTANPDVEMRLDNNIRINVGWRMKSRDPGIANAGAQDENEYLFDKGDMVNKRIDLFTEFDFTYQKNLGFRLSGAAWYDDAYGDNGKGNPVGPGNTAGLVNQAYPGYRFTDYVKRFYHGPSGEFLDAFVWGNFSVLGDTQDLNVKVGRFATLWGVPVFGTAAANSVSADMAPGDNAKAVLSPGATAKETTLPIAQTIATLRLTDNISVSGQVTHEWRSSRFPEGGTYLGAADAILYGPPQSSSAVTRAGTTEGKNGDISLMVSTIPTFWFPQGTNISFYARKFSQKTPTWVANLSLAPTQIRTVFENDVKLWGVSMDTSMQVIPYATAAAVGMEISHRSNQPLNINPGGVTTAAGNFEGPKGDTWHALANFTQIFGQNMFWDTASLLGEVTYQRLDKVTDNAGLYKSAQYLPAGSAVCSGDEIVKGCSTKDAYHLSLLFSPTWQQVLPGWDLNGTILYQTGLKGNAPTTGINEGASLNLFAAEMVYATVHSFRLSYTNYYGKGKYLSTATAAGNAGPVKTCNGTLCSYGDRDILQFTYNYSF